ncbi:hypothetical protein HZA97_01480 [Candidatus Woesearchaeota archaeon]|nr:hypothetical protein [Candidatus Woesearchaeota archaeon]
MVKVPWNIYQVKIDVSKHFALKYMNKWNWDFHELREAVRDAYKIEKVGKNKYEIYVQKQGFKKVVSVYYFMDDILFCITGSEGGKRK